MIVARYAAHRSVDVADNLCPLGLRTQVVSVFAASTQDSGINSVATVPPEGQTAKSVTLAATPMGKDV
jgi:hypothetical protein